MGYITKYAGDWSDVSCDDDPINSALTLTTGSPVYGGYSMTFTNNVAGYEGTYMTYN